MIRLPNPKSDIQEYIKIIAIIHAHVEENSQSNFDFDDISKNLTKIGNISSQKAYGTKAMEASFREDRSLDAVFNQSKALSEVLRLLGLIVAGENQHTFRITMFGKFVASYVNAPRELLKNQILDLLSHSFLNINFKHPQINGNNLINVKPFLAVLKILPAIDGFITKNEFNYFILTLENDNDTALLKAKEDILKIRLTKESLDTHKTTILLDRKISENTASNYTRIPLAFFKAFKLLRKTFVKNEERAKLYLNDDDKFIDGNKALDNTEIYVLDVNGQAILKKLLTFKTYNYKNLEGLEKNERIFIAIKSLTDFYNYSDTAKPFYTNTFEPYLNESVFAFPYHILNPEEIEEFEKNLKALNMAGSFSIMEMGINELDEIEYYTFGSGEEITSTLNIFPKLSSGIEFGCLNCRPAKCCEYSIQELTYKSEKIQEIPDKNPGQVCPVNAIHFDSQFFPHLDYSKCIDCGICISRCDYGAINYQNDELTISQTLSKQNLMSAKGSLPDVINHFASLRFTLKHSFDNELMLQILAKFLHKISKLKKDDFYPLIRNLLRTLDLKAKIGRSGDSQWRYDALVVEPFVMPIEIKSFTETKDINPDSIRQAIENSITIEASHELTKKAISAVVAVMYANKRGATESMLKDAKELHNIRILLISVIVLSYLNLKNLENKFTIKDINYLFLNTVGAFDLIAIREFWINFLARREELKALDQHASYFEIKSKIDGQKLDFQKKLKEEYEVFEKVFELIKAKK